MSGSHVSLSSELQSPHMASPLGGPGLQTQPASLPGASSPVAETPLASPPIPSPLPLLPPLWGFAKWFPLSGMPTELTSLSLCFTPLPNVPAPKKPSSTPAAPREGVSPAAVLHPLHTASPHLRSYVWVAVHVRAGPGLSSLKRHLPVRLSPPAGTRLA